MATVDWAHLCDYGFFDQGGKACLIGIFSAVAVARVPAKHTRAAIAFATSLGHSEAARVRIRIMRPDKGELATFRLPDFEAAAPHRRISIFGIDNMMLPDFGPYEIMIYLNDALAKTIPFIVRQVAP